MFLEDKFRACCEQLIVCTDDGSAGNECQLINDRMFVCDERKQAYLEDLAAGTSRQQIEAAESCQATIIHAGRPRDPAEPGLADLLVRAEPFR